MKSDLIVYVGKHSILYKVLMICLSTIMCWTVTLSMQGKKFSKQSSDILFLFFLHQIKALRVQIVSYNLPEMSEPIFQATDS